MKLKILHLEDSEEDATLVRRELTRASLSYDLLWVSDEAAYVKALREFNPDIILSDHSLPGFNSMQALTLLKNNGNRIPFILVTATIAEESAVMILKLGAQDYILKDRIKRLPAAVLSAIEKHRADRQILEEHRLLQMSEANLGAIIENSDAFIYSLDLELNYIFFNAKLKNIMAEVYGVNLLVGAKVVEFLGDHETNEIVNWTAAYGRVLTGEAQHFVKDYSTKTKKSYINFSINPIFEKGIVIGISCIANDVTVQYIAEVEKASMVEQLIRQNNDLIQFSFIASHNIRGPVASLLGLLNLIDHEELPDHAAELLSHFRSSVKQLDLVTHDIAETLSIRTGESYAREILGLKASVTEIELLIHDQLTLRQGIIVSDVYETAFLTIRPYFHNILYNLLTNAIKFSDSSRKLLIEVHSFQTEISSGFTVNDNGLGIDLDKYGAKVFGLYHRFHAEVDGRGLGLFITKIQVEALNGQIYIDSVVGKGTHFKVEFPLA